MGELALLGVVLLFVWILKLQKRIDHLENQGRRPAQARSNSPAASPRASTAQSETKTKPVPPGQSIGPDAVERLILWIKEDWLLKLGAGLILIGLGWFVSYAFLHNWIGPIGRITVGLLIGSVLLAFGWWRLRVSTHQGGIFMVLGSTTIILTTFAGREIYDFYPPLVALLIMFISTALVALASVRYKLQSMAVFSLILAGIAPWLTDSRQLIRAGFSRFYGSPIPDPDFVMWFAYLTVVVLGTIWVVSLTDWRKLTPIALLIAVLHSMPQWMGLFRNTDQEILMLFGFGLAAISFIFNSLGVIRAKDRRATSDLLTAAGNGLFLLIWILTAAADEWQSLIISAWMVAFSVGAFALYKAAGRREPFYVYAGVGIAR